MKKTAKPVSLYGLAPETVLGYPQPQPMETPGQQKAKRVLDLVQQHDQLGKESAVMSESLTPHLDAFFEKQAEAQLTDAQRRYPELLKVAAPGTYKTPALAKRRAPGTDAGSATASPPVQSSLSGGAA